MHRDSSRGEMACISLANTRFKRLRACGTATDYGAGEVRHRSSWEVRDGHAGIAETAVRIAIAIARVLPWSRRAADR